MQMAVHDLYNVAKLPSALQFNLCLPEIKPQISTLTAQAFGCARGAYIEKIFGSSDQFQLFRFMDTHNFQTVFSQHLHSFRCL